MRAHPHAPKGVAGASEEVVECDGCRCAAACIAPRTEGLGSWVCRPYPRVVIWRRCNARPRPTELPPTARTEDRGIGPRGFKNTGPSWPVTARRRELTQAARHRMAALLPKNQLTAQHIPQRKTCQKLLLLELCCAVANLRRRACLAAAVVGPLGAARRVRVRSRLRRADAGRQLEAGGAQQALS